MSYSAFALHYDRLTRNVEYEKRADYVCRILEKLGGTAGLTLDLACGTGSLTIALAKRGFDIYGIDASAEMLSVARQKSVEDGLDILFLRQKMQAIDLYGTVGTVICSLDSLNHLTSEEEVRETFQRVSLFMEQGGFFLFDVNTIYKHRYVLAGQTFIYDLEDVYCVWQNHYDEKTCRVGMELDFFAKEKSLYRRSSERFYERAYPNEKLIALLRETGFEVSAVYDDLTFDAPRPESERVVYIAKKI